MTAVGRTCRLERAGVLPPTRRGSKVKRVSTASMRQAAPFGLALDEASSPFIRARIASLSRRPWYPAPGRLPCLGNRELGRSAR